MKEEIISFKTAKLALEKNITFPSTTSYTKDGDICDNESILGKVVKKYPIISQSLLQRILREDYNLIVYIIPIKNGYECFVAILKDKFVNDIYNYCKFQEHNYNFYKSYEEALEFGLQGSIKLIEND